MICLPSLVLRHSDIMYFQTGYMTREKQNISTVFLPGMHNLSLIKRKHQGFPNGSVVRKLPANVGDVRLIPDPGRSHMPQSNQAGALESPGVAASKVHAPRGCSPQLREATAVQSARCDQTVAPTHNSRKAQATMKTQHSQK